MGISLGNLVEERRPVRESSDDEFFRLCESPALPYQPYAEEKLRTMLLVILERCAGDPGMDEQRLCSIVQRADQACFEAYGETISGLPCPSPHLQQTIGEALELMASSEEVMRIENRNGKAARHLPLVKADLRRLNAAEYIIIEHAICLALA